MSPTKSHKVPQIPHLKWKNGTYRYRRRLPGNVGGEVAISLDTDSLEEAIALAKELDRVSKAHMIIPLVRELQGHANARTLSLAVALKYAVARLPRRMSALSEPTRRRDDTVLASSLRRSPMWRQRHLRTLHKPDDVGRASRPIRSVLECSPTFKPSAPLQHRANSTSAHNPQAR